MRMMGIEARRDASNIVCVCPPHRGILVWCWSGVVKILLHMPKISLQRYIFISSSNNNNNIHLLFLKLTESDSNCDENVILAFALVVSFRLVSSKTRETESWADMEME